MKPSANSTKQEAAIFLQALKEEGIEEIYIAPRQARAVSQTTQSQAQAPAQKAATATGSAKDELMQWRDKALACTLCDELASKRKNVVFGSGNVNARLMLIGEAPGHDEDEQGLPFVGQAGQLLTKIIESIGLTRQQVFIANVLKCRPPGNRQPQPAEISNCRPYLEKQIELIRPQILCALGTFAAQTLLKTTDPISKLRGRFIDFSEGTKIMCTFHPAYLLRNPGEKRKVWDDMKSIKAELERLSS